MDNEDNRVLKRRGRPKKSHSNEELIAPEFCKPFKLLKMCVLDNKNHNIRPWWIAEFDGPIDFKILTTSIRHWKVLHIDNYCPQYDVEVTVPRSRGRPKGSVSKRRVLEDIDSFESSEKADGND
ncbi:hypothetical protein BmR1_04g09195 [Babesia microti strain RI]|uniref:Uncharacterized protein n=1 Tax=Babesia microti (strain RI) TaxID=1133968 RepID=I7JDU4_BABMR|nr:hypothetical protein BmR1_04g09195 [Babesia microti strain RI]CCF76015.1 hypothetical protein BmR1_04g09195 [Babesia microti strain RI]|eukprot:XP_012650423.1 hypothetical protein BmR1_04g09195 [Babesia microti strain RI]